MDNSAYLQFMWKADVVESWVADKESHVKNEEYGRDLSTVQTLLTKQETFDAGMYFPLLCGTLQAHCPPFNGKYT